MINKNTAILYYLKYPIVPILDYYIDADGNYVALDEGEIHTWVAGEKTSDGQATSPGEQYTSLTVETDWKYQDKLELASRILSAMGIENGDSMVYQYSQQLKVEQ